MQILMKQQDLGNYFSCIKEEEIIKPLKYIIKIITKLYNIKRIYKIKNKI